MKEKKVERKRMVEKNKERLKGRKVERKEERKKETEKNHSLQRFVNLGNKPSSKTIYEKKLAYTTTFFVCFVFNPSSYFRLLGKAKQKRHSVSH